MGKQSWKPTCARRCTHWVILPHGRYSNCVACEWLENGRCLDVGGQDYHMISQIERGCVSQPSTHGFDYIERNSP
jgi:hypothetical protein